VHRTAAVFHGRPGDRRPATRYRLPGSLSLPVASAVQADVRAGLNTFVVPVAADSDERDPLAVDLPLAQSLLTHLPPALRLADATRRQLYVANGPFLVTLPGRLGKVPAA
jgi:hypothetical protein